MITLYAKKKNDDEREITVLGFKFKYKTDKYQKRKPLEYYKNQPLEEKIKKISAQFKKKVAYIPETPVIYPELTLKEHIELTMLAYDLGEDSWDKANELLTMFRLQEKLDWLPVHFSKGMQQKVMIVCAFLTKAELLVIDEPFTGLDPLAVANFIDLIKQACAEGREVLMTTHVLADAQQAIKTYAILNQGTIEFVGSLPEIRAHYGLKETDSFDKLYQVLYQEESRDQHA